MTVNRILLAAFASVVLIHAGSTAFAKNDIPGVVVVDDENALEEPIAFTAIADPKTLGQTESAFTCDLQDGDSECTAVAVDTATDGSVVLTMLQIHQPNLLEHKGNEAFVKQKKLYVTMAVFDDAVDPVLLGEADAVLSGCKGVAGIKDVDGNDTQDKASWSLSCKEATMSAFVLTLDGDDAATAMAAAQEVMAGASKKGRIRLAGKDGNGPSVLSPLLQMLDDEL